MNRHNRFQPYQIAVDGGQLVITGLELSNEILREDIKSFYVMTNDNPERKSTDSKRKHFCARLMFCNSNGHLKLYFTTYDSMKAAIDRFLLAQGFSHRLD